jgi:uncharacterized protein YukE
MYDICSAILAINPKAQVSVNGEDLDQITWHNGTAEISKSDIQAKQAELKKIYDDLAYSRARSEAYPSWEKQLEKIYDDGIDKWKSEMVDPVKAKYPKPE